VGLRPTHGAVPNTGCFPVSDQYDTIGPLARSVADVARTYEIIAGYDARDAHTSHDPIRSFAQAFAQGVKGLKIGLPEAWAYANDVDPEIATLLRAALGMLADLGADVHAISLAEAPDAQMHLMPILAADAAAVHANRMESQPDVFGADVLDRLMVGKRFTSEGYANALRFREKWLRRIEATFADVDVIVTPTCPVTAPLVTDAQRMLETTRRLSHFTYAWAFSGTPALSVPIGFSSAGLPAAMQIVAPRWYDARALGLGAHYQQSTEHHLRRPRGFPAALDA
jgi:aspartyl-tRNA(Asn)/glutamyl-tRNA(Gln) amidotransferase subunit A